MKTKVVIKGKGDRIIFSSSDGLARVVQYGVLSFRKSHVQIFCLLLTDLSGPHPGSASIPFHWQRPLVGYGPVE